MTRPNAAATPPMVSVDARLSTAVSGSPRATATHVVAPKTTRIQKIVRQPATVRTQPPTMGARMGATPMTSMSDERTRACFFGPNTSRTTARAITTPAHPPSAWRPRHSRS